GRALFFMERDAEAVKELVQSIDQWPSVWYNRCYLAAAHAFAGNQPAAEAALAEFNNVPDFAGWTLGNIAECETHVPARSAAMDEGRKRFHEGLRRAGMPD